MVCTFVYSVHCNLIVNNSHYFLLFTLVPESFDMSYIERDVLYILFLQFLREDLFVVYLKNCLFLLNFRKCFLVCARIACGIRTNGTRTIGTQCFFAYADSRHPVNLSTRTIGTRFNCIPGQTAPDLIVYPYKRHPIKCDR
jgi:hypothetical protein